MHNNLSKWNENTKRLKMYSKIQQLKKYGLNKAQTSRKLNINYKTIRKY